jgi:hypothetical protein
MTEVVTLATAVVVLAGAVVTWRTRKQVKQVSTTIHKVHVLVNSRFSEMETRINQLTAALTAEGTPVPPAPGREEGT